MEAGLNSKTLSCLKFLINDFEFLSHSILCTSTTFVVELYHNRWNSSNQLLAYICLPFYLPILSLFRCLPFDFLTPDSNT